MPRAITQIQIHGVYQWNREEPLDDIKHSIYLFTLPHHYSNTVIQHTGVSQDSQFTMLTILQVSQFCHLCQTLLIYYNIYWQQHSIIPVHGMTTNRLLVSENICFTISQFSQSLCKEEISLSIITINNHH